jgi:ergothioneine biosynthesis glutamate--cysteine ligase EgtA
MAPSRTTRPAVAERGPVTLDSAHEYVGSRALLPGPVGRVGLELEAHLVDLDAPATRPSWDRIQAALDRLEPPPAGGRVTVEPGGQLEVSTAPFADSAGAIGALRRDQLAVRAELSGAGLGLACVGADPVRESLRVNPNSRYTAMESYFGATGNGPVGRAMMCSTASLQINLEAGPARRWSERIQLAHRLGPVLVALSACSPVLGGRVTGWRSSRQRIWGELDQARCGPLLAGAEPAREWADYAMQAPVMMVRDPVSGDVTPMRVAVPFGSWAAGRAELGGRRPTADDLDQHLTTLFPPVRLRGFVELRYLDAVPERWWPALTALVVALFDDPAAVDVASEACESVPGDWTLAAREGLADPRLARAALRCVEGALRAVPPELKDEAERYAELVESGRCPGDEFTERAACTDAATALQEVARA